MALDLTKEIERERPWYVAPRNRFMPPSLGTRVPDHCEIVILTLERDAFGIENEPL